MLNKSYFLFSSLFFLSVVLSSCASINPTPVSDADRDQTGAFDGSWRLTERPLNSVQTIGQNRFRCKFIKKEVNLIVSKSVGQISIGEYQASGNIAANGRFRIEIPTDREFRTNNNHNSEENKITYIYQGKLGKGVTSGLFTIGKKALNNSGCSTKITIENRNSAKQTFLPGNPGTKNVVGKWSFTSKNIPGVAAPSKLTTNLTINKDGKHFFGELEIDLLATPACGELRSTTVTKVRANLIDESKLILTVMGDTVPKKVTCADDYLSAETFSNRENLFLELSKTDNGRQLEFNETCGWFLNDICIYDRPPLLTVASK